MTAVPRKIMLPIGSSSTISLVRGRAGGLSAAWGLKKEMVAAAMKPPRGRLK